ncbi:MAG: hypothetical protein JXM73_09540 [Anaerolineae bacterium]|nr:hypothetical protein [Anaerolineae bacterium]
MDRLAGIDLLIRAEEGNRVFYYLNPRFPLLAELTALFQKTVGGEAGGRAPKAEPKHRPEPSLIKQPFAWMETPAASPLPPEMKRIQSSGEWDQTY